MLLQHSRNIKSKSQKLLDLSASTWFVVAFVGQIIFAYYIIFLYGKSGVQGNLENWNAASPHGYQIGDFLGNLVFGVHVALAAIITLGGPLQIIPQIRKIAPTFHRINGRIYVSAALLISMAGLYLTWVRGSVGGMVGAVFISINGFIILTCAIVAIRYAMAKKFDKHYRWALRLFLAMSGVYFFRVGIMLWLTIHQAPVGFDPVTFQGPFLTFLYVLVYIMPLVFLELYFQAKFRDTKYLKTGMAIFIFVITAGMIVGIFGATMGMWLPRL